MIIEIPDWFVNTLACVGVLTMMLGAVICLGLWLERKIK